MVAENGESGFLRGRLEGSSYNTICVELEDMTGCEVLKKRPGNDGDALSHSSRQAL